jgi:HK97 family phage major capsid protein
MKIDELREDRFKLVKEARNILDEAEGRDLTAEENNLYEAKMAEVDTLGDKIEKAEKAEAREAKVNGLMSEMDKPINEAIKPEADAGDIRASENYEKAFRSYLMANSDYEARALQADLDASGGYTVAPQQFVANLIKAMDNATVVRSLATRFSVPNAESLGAPSLDNDPGDPTWTAEILTGSADSTMSFGKRELNPHPLARSIRLSKKLVRASSMNIEQLVRDRLAYKAAVVEENAFLNGSGANEPLGVFTASDDGIGTGQDVSTGNASTSIGADGLIEAKYSIKSGYWGSARWIFHRDGVKQIRKLKDGDGQYIWKAGLASDRGDTILDMPVLMSEYAPNTFTAALYVGILGDFSYYWIADALDATIQVLVELYAATNQNGYILRLESDGMPVLAEAFARVKLGS